MGTTHPACCQHVRCPLTQEQQIKEFTNEIDCGPDDDAEEHVRLRQISGDEEHQPQEEKLDASLTLSTHIPESSEAQSETTALADKQVKAVVDSVPHLEDNDKVYKDQFERTTPQAVCRAVAELGQRGEWARAEAFIVEAMDGMSDEEQYELWKKIARDENVKQTLLASRILMEARETLPRPPEKLWEKIWDDGNDNPVVDSTASRASCSSSTSQTLDSMGSRASTAKSEMLGFPGWTGLAPVRLDIKSLVKAPPEYFRGLDTSAKLLWRYEGNSLQIKIICQLPTDHPTLPKSWPLAIISMLCEADLMSAFNPVIVAPPQLLRPQTLDFSTWKEQNKIRFVLSEVGVQEMKRLFTDDGLIVLKTSKVTNMSDPRAQELSIPNGYKFSEGAGCSMVVFCISDFQFASISTTEVPLPQGTRIPSWLLNFILSWMFPTMIRKMAKVASTIFSNPEYVKRFEADETGLYARVTKAVADAKAYEKKTGRKFNVYSSVTRPRCDSFKGGSLAQRVATFKALRP